MTQVIKVFTPIKRVPTMIGKAQNGQKLPFGPYTLPQVGGVSVSLIATGVAATALPVNPAITFLIGIVVTIAVGFVLGLIPYTGVRLTSRVLWFGRLILDPRPVPATGMPVTPASSRITVFIEETVVAMLPGDVRTSGPVRARRRVSAGAASTATTVAAAAASKSLPVTPGPQLPALIGTGRVHRPAPTTTAARTAAPARNWRAMVSGNGVRARAGEER